MTTTPADRLLADLAGQLTQLRADGLYKDEAPLTTAQSAHIGVGAEQGLEPPERRQGE